MMRKLFRGILYRIRANERLLMAKIRARPRGWMARITSAGMLKFSRDGVCRGLAVGMFWGFVPIPFQMAPATFFCWLSRANLPVAIACVWISNPLTYAPILFLEYQIGVMLFGLPPVEATGMDMVKLSQMPLGDIVSLWATDAQAILWPMLQGAIVLSISLSLAGYIAGAAMFSYLEKRKELKGGEKTHAPHSH